MIQVTLTATLADQFSGGQRTIEIDVSSVRNLLRELDTRYPGLGAEIERANGLAINGEFVQDPLGEVIPADAEVFVLPKIAGG